MFSFTTRMCTYHIFERTRHKQHFSRKQQQQWYQSSLKGDVGGTSHTEKCRSSWDTRFNILTLCPIWYAWPKCLNIFSFILYQIINCLLCAPWLSNQWDPKSGIYIKGGIFTRSIIALLISATLLGLGPH